MGAAAPLVGAGPMGGPAMGTAGPGMVATDAQLQQQLMQQQQQLNLLMQQQQASLTQLGLGPPPMGGMNQPGAGTNPFS